MKINNISIEKFNDNKVKLNDQYEAEKKTEWEKRSSICKFSSC